MKITTEKLLKEEGLKIDLGAQYSIKCQFAQIDNLAKTASANSVMHFVNSIIGAREAGFIDGNSINLTDLHQIARNHVNDNYQTPRPYQSKAFPEEWGDEFYKELTRE